MFWFVFAILGAVFFFTPYSEGLFFDDYVMYFVESALFVTFMIWVIYMLVKKKTELPSVYLLIFIIPITYLIAFFTAESPIGNFNNLLRWLAYASFFVMLIWLRQDKQKSHYLPVFFQITAIAIALFSLFGYLGWIDYRDIVMGQRLTGPFQYANTFGAVMGAFWIFSLIMSTRKLTHFKMVCLYALPVVLFGTVFMLSYSRGVFIFFPIAWFIGLILLPFKNQLIYLIHSFISIVFSLILYALYTSDTPIVVSLIVLVAAIAIYTVVSMFLSHKQKLDPAIDKLIERNGLLKRSGRYITAVVIVAIGALLAADLLNSGVVHSVLPSSLQERLNDINLETSSASGRLNMYEDALRISKDYIVTGAGGDAWRYLYAVYQDEPYLSNEIHSGYLEILLGVGWIGFVLFMGMLIAFIYVALRKLTVVNENDRTVSIAALSASAMLLLHSAIDFDFSFGLVWFIILWLLAMCMPRVAKVEPIRERNGLRRIKPYVASGAAVLAIVGLFFSFRFFMAEQSASKLSGQISMDQAINAADSMTSLNPYSTDYLYRASTVYFQILQSSSQPEYTEKIVDAAQKARDLEPRNGIILYNFGNLFAQLGDPDRAIEYMTFAHEANRFQTDYINSLINIKSQIAFRAQLEGNDERAKSYAEAVRKDYEEYKEWFEEFKDKSIPDKRNIRINTDAYISTAGSLQILQEDAAALEILYSMGAHLEPGIYDPEQKKVLTQDYTISTLENLLRSYSNQIVVLSVRDEATNKLPVEVRNLLLEMGASIDQLEYRGSYAAVITDGYVLKDEVQNSTAVEWNAENAPELTQIFGGKAFRILSAGNPHGNDSSIQLDGVEYSKNGRGVNMVIFDKQMNLIGSFHFDTFQSPGISVFKY
ncbi:O-antigen ligase family protein [Marinicrinis lubricantis]|uniref:O-antigen ligase family protein n=1 Tax=Marinicrinis lubricantis TaxID=2086470 RepID=A0ABW1IKF3_9BACL